MTTVIRNLRPWAVDVEPTDQPAFTAEPGEDVEVDEALADQLLQQPANWAAVDEAGEVITTSAAQDDDDESTVMAVPNLDDVDTPADETPSDDDAGDGEESDF